MQTVVMNLIKLQVLYQLWKIIYKLLLASFAEEKISIFIASVKSYIVHAGTDQKNANRNEIKQTSTRIRMGPPLTSSLV